jgi:hypothetical protein
MEDLWIDRGFGRQAIRKAWQKQRLMATAMQHYVEQSVVGYRHCHIRS